MLIDELIERKRDFVVVRNPVLFQHDGGQARQFGVSDGIHQLVHLLTLKQRLECFAMVIFCVLKER